MQIFTLLRGRVVMYWLMVKNVMSYLGLMLWRGVWVLRKSRRPDDEAVCKTWAGLNKTGRMTMRFCRRGLCSALTLAPEA